jgi:hypothetical protein
MELLWQQLHMWHTACQLTDDDLHFHPAYILTQALMRTEIKRQIFNLIIATNI